MSDTSQAVLGDRSIRPGPPPGEAHGTKRATRPDIAISIYNDLSAVEDIWRQLERHADCTVFQTFDWLAAWQRHIGALRPETPAIVIGRLNGTEVLFLLPLAVSKGPVRRLEWLGSDLCDYNAPLLAPGFSDRVSDVRFRRIWRAVCRALQARPQHRHDVVELTKMPASVGAQANPFLALPVGLNPSGAHVAELPDTWDAFYAAKRSPTTRRRDRTKRKRLAELGEVQLVTPRAPDDIARTLDTLFAQKAKAFARMGIADVFASPGYRDFFFDLALNPRTQHLVHISRLDVGSTAAAVNFGLTFHHSYYHVVASYDDGEVSRFGPGAAHLRELLSHAIGLGCRRFDFTIGDEPYKLEWSDQRLDLYDHVSAATARGWVQAGLLHSRRHVKRLIKQNPRLWTMFTRLRAKAGSGSRRSDAAENDAAPRTVKAPPISPE